MHHHSTERRMNPDHMNGHDGYPVYSILDGQSNDQSVWNLIEFSSSETKKKRHTLIQTWLSDHECKVSFQLSYQWLCLSLIFHFFFRTRDGWLNSRLRKSTKEFYLEYLSNNMRESCGCELSLSIWEKLRLTIYRIIDWVLWLKCAPQLHFQNGCLRWCIGRNWILSPAVNWTHLLTWFDASERNPGHQLPLSRHPRSPCIQASNKTMPMVLPIEFTQVDLVPVLLGLNCIKEIWLQ